MAKRTTKASKEKSTDKPAPAEAAVTEVLPAKEPKTIEWRGHTFKLPDELPKSLPFRIAELEEAGNDARPMLRLLKSLLEAAGEPQYPQVIGEIEAAENEDEVIEDAFALVNEIFEQYGTDEGELEASEGS